MEHKLIAKYNEQSDSYHVSDENPKYAWVPKGVDQQDDHNWYSYIPNIKANSPEEAVQIGLMLILKEDWKLVYDPLWAWR